MKMIDDVCIPLSTIKEWHKVLDGWRTGMSNEDDLFNVMNTLEEIVMDNQMKDTVKDWITKANDIEEGGDRDDVI